MCHLPTARIHGFYRRTVADLPWASIVVRCSLLVRTFFCDAATCPRTIFTERLPNLVAPWARRTLHLTKQQQQLGLALGGNPDARLRADLDCGTSRNTLLCLVRRLPIPEPANQRSLRSTIEPGRKDRYRTIILDLERQRPIALLEDRDAETLTAWLQQHPIIRIIALLLKVIIRINIGPADKQDNLIGQTLQAPGTNIRIGTNGYVDVTQINPIAGYISSGKLGSMSRSITGSTVMLQFPFTGFAPTQRMGARDIRKRPCLHYSKGLLVQDGRIVRQIYISRSAQTHKGCRGCGPSAGCQTEPG